MAVSDSLSTGLFLGPPAYEARTRWRPLQALVASVLVLVTATLLAIAAAVSARLAGINIGERGATELGGLGLWQAATVALTLVAGSMLGGRAWSVLSLGRPAGGPFVYLQALLLMAALQIAVCAPAAYALAKLHFRGRDALFGLVLVGLLLPHQVLALPHFILASKLGILNSYAALIFPFAVSPFGIFLFRQFFKSIPDDVVHAARIDGLSEFAIVWRIIRQVVKQMADVVQQRRYDRRGRGARLFRKICGLQGVFELCDRFASVERRAAAPDCPGLTAAMGGRAHVSSGTDRGCS